MKGVVLDFLVFQELVYYYIDCFNIYEDVIICIYSFFMVKEFIEFFFQV